MPANTIISAAGSSLPSLSLVQSPTKTLDRNVLSHGHLPERPELAQDPFLE